ncbi:MAG: S-layer homology domain-containing protein [Clostridia bacterium]
MNKYSKIVALSLATTSILSTMALATFPDDAKIDLANKYAVSRLADYNVVNGDLTGNFQPEKSVSRAEMAKMIAVTLNKGDITTTSTTNFADCNGHWAEKYIAYCVDKGIIAGKSDTRFEPESNVTGTEAAKMLLIALGFDAEKAGLVGADWDINTYMNATMFGLYYDISANTSVAITKEVAAQIISNALASNTATLSGSDYVETSQSLLSKLGYSANNTSMARSIYDRLDSQALVSPNMGGFTGSISDLYKISDSLLVDAHLSVTQLIVGIDEVFIAKVATGKMTEVEEALNARIEYLINEKAFYPSDRDTANTAKIYKQGDYIMLYVSGTEDNYAKAETVFKQYAK